MRAKSTKFDVKMAKSGRFWRKIALKHGFLVFRMTPKRNADGSIPPTNANLKMHVDMACFFYKICN